MHYALEQELLRLFRPEVVETVLCAAHAELAGEPGSPAQLRRIVGARLLDELADALARAQENTIEQTSERETPARRDEDTVSVQLPDAGRVRDRRTRRWTPASELSRRAG